MAFLFLDKDTYEKLALTRWLDKSGHPIPGHPELPVETGAEIKVLANVDPVPLELLVRSNLAQQELTRLGSNSIALLNKTVKVAPDVMRKLRDLLDREVEREDHESMETMQRLTITARTGKRPVAIRSRDVELDCRSIVNQLVNSIPKVVLLRTSYVERQQTTGTQTSQEVSVKLKTSVARGRSRARTVHPEMKHCPGSQVISLGRDDLSGESRNVKNKSDGGDADSISSSDGSQSQS